MVKRRYSRLAKIEEKRNLRSAIIFGFLTIAFIIFMLFLGLPTLIKISSFLADIGKGSQTIEIFDNTPPAPPQLIPLPKFTKDPNLQISGTTEAGATVKIYLNNTSKEVLADADGRFTSSLTLKEGENYLYAIAKDTSGNESGESKKFTVLYDKEPPKLEITEPAKTDFYGDQQKVVNIKGLTENTTSIKINDRLVIVDNNGEFSYLATLNEGENNFKIIAEDQAGNQTEESLTLRFTP